MADARRPHFFGEGHAAVWRKREILFGFLHELLEEALLPLIVRTIQGQIALGIDTSLCYCIGRGENCLFLSRLNTDYRFFGAVIALAYPRFITQCHATQRDVFVEKYLTALCRP